MKLRLGCISLCFITTASVFSGTIAETNTITNIYELEKLFEEKRNQLMPISPPSEAVYVHSSDVLVPVDWKKFPRAFTKQMYAKMDSNGYPIYEVTIYEDPTTRQLVFVNSFGTSIYWLDAVDDYDPYVWQKEYFQISDISEVDDWNRWIFDPAHISVTFELIPELFYSDYQATQEAESFASLEMLTLSGPPVPGGDGGTNPPPSTIISTNNSQVTLMLGLSENFGAYAEIYGREMLVWGSWDLMADWVPTYGADSLEWLDVASSNKATFFYQFFDATIDSDGDGHSDSREAWSGTDSNVFNGVNTDSDDLHDWWELKLFGSLNQVGSDDFDGDGLLNNEELVWVTGGVPVMYSDPSLFDTDGEGLDDGLEDFLETNPLESDTDGDGLNDAVEVLVKKTDPNNPDTVSPIVGFL